VAEAGYDGIEICGFPPHVSTEAYATKESRRDLVKLLSDLNLGVAGYLADFSAVNPVVVSHTGKYLDVFRKNIELCVDLGSPSIRVDTVAAPGSISNSEYKSAFGRLAETWWWASDYARNAGVRTIWEFEPGFVFNKPSEVLAMHDAVAHPNFKVIFDSAHAYMCSVVGARQHGPKETLSGGIQEFVKKLGNRIGHVHLVDSDGTLYGDETSTHRMFGQGVIDFRALAPALAALPLVEWWCIDLCFCADAWDMVENSLEYVHQLLGKKATV
jgi:sugar phosphate isomerase/epimerase